MKEIKIKLVDEKSLKFELLEDASRGDVVNLNSLNLIDFSDFISSIKNLKDHTVSELIKNKVNHEKENLSLIHSKIEYDSKLNYEKQIKLLKDELTSNELNFLSKVNKKVSELEKELHDKELAKERSFLEKEKQFTNKFTDLEFSKNKVINDQNTKISDLDSKLQNFEREYNLKKNEEISKLKLETESKINFVLKEKEELSLKLGELERKRNSLNIKLIGQNLENWINEKLQKNFAFIDRINIEKEPKPINGNKPDFLIKIKNGLDFSKIVIEAKSELLDSVNKRTNRSYLEKLEKDRLNFKAEYAILVTELEQESNFLISKDSEYKNIFIVRPPVLIELLNFMINLLMVNQMIFDQNVQFENRQEILNKWISFKDDADKTFTFIGNNIKSIISEKDKLIKIAETINTSANLILSKHLNTLQNKLNAFNIERKILNKIEKAETDLLLPSSEEKNKELESYSDSNKETSPSTPNLAI